MRFACLYEEIEISGIRRCFESAKPGFSQPGIAAAGFRYPRPLKRGRRSRPLRWGSARYTSNCGVLELREALAREVQKGEPDRLHRR